MKRTSSLQLDITMFSGFTLVGDPVKKNTVKMNKLKKNRVAVRTLFIAGIIAAIAVSLLPGVLYAHGSEQHADDGVSVNLEQDAGENTSAVNATLLPEEIANIGGDFNLINHEGEAVTEQTYAGKHMLVFFGYSNCQVMCSISLKRIADALTILQADTSNPLSKLNSVVVTVDPENDTPEQLKSSLSAFHPALTGLTGTLEQLKPVYKAYNQKPAVLEFDFNDRPVVEHQSYFYLMGPDGKLQTLFPPILNLSLIHI